MFKSDVTQNYNHQDATLEILLMLAGAFLLGCLLCWLIRKLYQTDSQVQTLTGNGNDYSVKGKTNAGAKNGTNGNIDRRTPQALTGAAVKKVPAVTRKTDASNYSTPRIDDLTKISGINTDVEVELKNRGIKSYTDLRDSSKQSLLDTLDAPSGKDVSSREAQTWPHQASLAAKGEWDKLKEYQEFLKRSNQAAEKVQSESQGDTGSDNSAAQPSRKKDDKDNGQDDLKKIEGIGPKIEEILNKNRINTYKDLRKSNRDTLKGHLNKAGNRFQMHEPESWPHQAGMAERGEWEDLKIYQEFMDGGREIPAASASSKIDDTDSTTAQAASKKSAPSLVIKTAETTSDDLKKIEGIGPKIEDVLNKNGIHTFKQLHQAGRDTLKKQLEAAGNQFQMHEPESWPHQAGMADRGEWEELRIYQEFMDGGREVPSASASSNLQAPDTSSSQQSAPKDNLKSLADDLKKIEGIGPKIQELLNKAGIKSFNDLKNSKRDTLKKLLDEAGPQYRIHEPETWPKQAALASKGEWEKLEKYQDELMGGR